MADKCVCLFCSGEGVWHPPASKKKRNAVCANHLLSSTSQHKQESNPRLDPRVDRTCKGIGCFFEIDTHRVAIRWAKTLPGFSKKARFFFQARHRSQWSMLKKKRFQHTVGVESRLCGSKSRGAGFRILEGRGEKEEKGAKIEFLHPFSLDSSSRKKTKKPFPTWTGIDSVSKHSLDHFNALEHGKRGLAPSRPVSFSFLFANEKKKRETNPTTLHSPDSHD